MNQHYVPRVYLKNFAERKGKEFYVNVLDTSSGKYITPNIKNICSEKNFYTLNEGTNVATDLMAVEKVYSEFIEPMYQKAYDIITNDSVININFTDRANLIIGVLQFFSRNPANLLPRIEKHRKEVVEIYDENKSKGKKGITYWDEDYSFRDYTFDEIVKDVENKVIKFFKETHLKATQEIIGFHEDAIFEVFKLNDGSRYFSGDNPLIIHDVIDGNREILKRSKEFIIPVNNIYALRIFHDNRKSPNQIYKSHSGNGSAWLINQDILKQSSRFIITDEKNLNEHKKLGKIINDTDSKKMIDLMRQITVEFKDDEETISERKVMEEFLMRYDAGNTNSTDEQVFFKHMHTLFKDFIKERLN